MLANVLTAEVATTSVSAGSALAPSQSQFSDCNLRAAAPPPTFSPHQHPPSYDERVPVHEHNSTCNVPVSHCPQWPVSGESTFTSGSIAVHGARDGDFVQQAGMKKRRLVDEDKLVNMRLHSSMDNSLSTNHHSEDLTHPSHINAGARKAQKTHKFGKAKHAYGGKAKKTHKFGKAKRPSPIKKTSKVRVKDESPVKLANDLLNELFAVPGATPPTGNSPGQVQYADEVPSPLPFRKDLDDVVIDRIIYIHDNPSIASLFACALPQLQLLDGYSFAETITMLKDARHNDYQEYIGKLYEVMDVDAALDAFLLDGVFPEDVGDGPQGARQVTPLPLQDSITGTEQSFTGSCRPLLEDLDDAAIDTIIDRVIEIHINSELDALFEFELPPLQLLDNCTFGETITVLQEAGAFAFHEFLDRLFQVMDCDAGLQDFLLDGVIPDARVLSDVTTVSAPSLPIGRDEQGSDGESVETPLQYDDRASAFGDKHEIGHFEADPNKTKINIQQNNDARADEVANTQQLPQQQSRQLSQTLQEDYNNTKINIQQNDDARADEVANTQQLPKQQSRQLSQTLQEDYNTIKINIQQNNDARADEVANTQQQSRQLSQTNLSLQLQQHLAEILQPTVAENTVPSCKDDYDDGMDMDCDGEDYNNDDYDYDEWAMDIDPPAYRYAVECAQLGVTIAY